MGDIINIRPKGVRPMKAEHKIWWEGIADQYEAWAAEPPMLSLSGCEYYTCSEFCDEVVHWGFCSTSAFEVVLRRLIQQAGYANTKYPIGKIIDSNRATKREAFCQDMADTIRENLH